MLYCLEIWGSTYKTYLGPVMHFQKRTAHTITFANVQKRTASGCCSCCTNNTASLYGIGNHLCSLAVMTAALWKFISLEVLPNLSSLCLSVKTVYWPPAICALHLLQNLASSHWYNQRNKILRALVLQACDWFAEWMKCIRRVHFSLKNVQCYTTSYKSIIWSFTDAIWNISSHWLSCAV